ncbi:GSCOCG00001211001-RA-CDS [Cotesia congregata]|uniref:Uncharacterized protein n=1 Tax=Cotesia congregata TaxID=51543 RepID=A0A8J2HFX9_COTCN|nr:GSCOCG00001211001-RA-CDS [Cotesia congregata]CAG5097435.1 Protein of unknown function [Cotesia congregata]
MSSTNGCENGVYIWIQGSIRGGACFVYGANGAARDYLRRHFRAKSDTADGIHMDAPATAVINALRVCNYQIHNSLSLEEFITCQHSRVVVLFLCYLFELKFYEQKISI